MKKGCLFTFILMALSQFLFAQTGDFNTLMKNADQFKKEKKLIHAMGNYWDACISTSDIEKAQLAYNKYSEIANLLEKGKTSEKEISVFEKHDEWQNLVYEFSQYWIENNPWLVTIDKPTHTKINYEERTANYNVRVNLSHSLKVLRFYSTLRTGYLLARDSGWPVIKPLDELLSENDKLSISFDINDSNGNKIIEVGYERGNSYRRLLDCKIEKVSQETTIKLDKDNLKFDNVVIVRELDTNDAKKKLSGKVFKFEIIPNQKYDKELHQHLVPLRNAKTEKILTEDSYIDLIENLMVEIPICNIDMLSTEVSVGMYDWVVSGRFASDKNKLNIVKMYDSKNMMKFCNMLSEKFSLTPVYKDTEDITKINQDADGFRLATIEECKAATYAGGGLEIYETLYYNVEPIDNNASKSKDLRIARNEPTNYGIYGLQDIESNSWIPFKIVRKHISSEKKETIIKNAKQKEEQRLAELKQKEEEKKRIEEEEKKASEERLRIESEQNRKEEAAARKKAEEEQITRIESYKKNPNKPVLITDLEMYIIKYKPKGKIKVNGSATSFGLSYDAKKVLKEYKSKIKLDLTDAEIESILSKAFQNCEAIEEISLPSTLKEINSYAFDGCKNLKTVILNNKSQARIKGYAFNNCPALSTVNYTYSFHGAGGINLEVGEMRLYDLPVVINPDGNKNFSKARLVH